MNDDDFLADARREFQRSVALHQARRPQRKRRVIFGSVLIAAVATPALAATIVRDDVSEREARQVLNYASEALRKTTCPPPPAQRGRTTLSDDEPTLQLRDSLAVFRRPATREDRLTDSDLQMIPGARGIYRASTRRVSEDGDGGALFVVAARSNFTPPAVTSACQSQRRSTAERVASGAPPAVSAALTRQLVTIESEEIEAAATAAGGAEDVIYLVHRHASGVISGGGGVSVGSVLERGLISSEQDADGRRRVGRLAVVVPDDVTTVRFEALQDSTAQRSIGRTVEVHDNVATAAIPSGKDEPTVISQTWIAADGTVAKTLTP